MNDNIIYILDLIKETSIGIKGFLMGQLKLFILSFFIFSIGLYLIDAPYYILIGLIIAIVDVLPVVGSGIILIPWSIYSFISKNSSFGYKLILLYIIAMVIRQILEPRILGKNIGLRPLYTFVSTFIGSLIFGPIGVFVGPIIAIILNTIYLKQTVRDLEENDSHKKTS